MAIRDNPLIERANSRVAVRGELSILGKQQIVRYTRLSK
jgi:hypothetical protein